MPVRALVRFLLDFAPIFVLFVSVRFTDFLSSVGIFVGVSVLVALLSVALDRRLPLVPLIFGAFVLSFGGATLLFSNPDLIIVADSIFYLLAGGALIYDYVRRSHFLKHLFSATFAITDLGWQTLTIRWALVLLLLGVVNEIVRALASPEGWVDFKFYSTILVVTFACTQFFVSAKHRLPNESNRLGLRTSDHSH